jgi:hypothetical protein
MYVTISGYDHVTDGQDRDPVMLVIMILRDVLARRCLAAELRPEPGTATSRHSPMPRDGFGSTGKGTLALIERISLTTNRALAL